MSEEDETKTTGDVIANINYFPPTGQPIPVSAWKPRYIGASYQHTRRMTIHDVRLTTKTFSLQTNGFQFVKLSPRQRVTATDDEVTINRTYYPELSDLVKKLTGASTAFVFNHVIRAHSSPSQKGILDAFGRWQDIPAAHPHVDYSGSPAHIAGTRRELSPNFPPEIASLYDSSSRIAYVNVWRPLSTVRRDPLAVCDCATVPDEDYQVRLRRFSRTGVESGNYVMSHAREEETHEWWYMSAMREDEVVVFREYDSEMRGGWRCPHTAFELEGTEEVEPRESIEARVVCFWE
ncbi:hypothetical protein BU23DRAFT_299230 [Bimuria novae-zelandiae CBS 107.79]|uniref:Uncharacterized protein n=1 Tax=Bimuria novae-zelandiae CBS 107.79 TaxID=1447943 RepID=A0A6A5VPC9_9PLEO|nr:hypothetical protein BU23DRAFT_299230 [Bimuria novae-zelandiae CBS 107.79]